MVFERHEGHCYMCNDELRFENRLPNQPKSWNVEHVIAKKNGEQFDNIENALAACWECNNRKRASSLSDCVRKGLPVKLGLTEGSVEGIPLAPATVHEIKEARELMGGWADGTGNRGNSVADFCAGYLLF